MNETNKPTPAISATITRADPTGGMSPDDTLLLTFADGRELKLRLGDLPANIIADAVMHGLKQKTVDTAAISRNPETGRSATVDDKFQVVAEVINRLLGGGWNKVREEGAISGLLLRALRELYPKMDILAYLARRTAAEQFALRRNPRVAEVIERLRAAAVKTPGIDTDDLLRELED